MNAEQAINILDQACSQLAVNREAQVQLVQAIDVIRKAIQPNEEVKKVETKPEAPKEETKPEEPTKKEVPKEEPKK